MQLFARITCDFGQEIVRRPLMYGAYMPGQVFEQLRLFRTLKPHKVHSYKYIFGGIRE